MKGIMFDLETLGCGDDAPIIQIGACVFNVDTDTVHDFYSRNIDWNSHHFGKIDIDTLMWWLRQDASVREDVFAQSDVLPLGAALVEFFDYLECHNGLEIWSKGVDFDVRLLRQAAERCGLELPFRYYKARDMRTIEQTFGIAADRPETIMAHDALADAKHQAEHLMNIVRRVNNYRVNPAR